MLKLEFIFVLLTAYLSQDQMVQADYFCKCIPNNGKDAMKGTQVDKGLPVQLQNCKVPTKKTGVAQDEREKKAIKNIKTQVQKDRILILLRQYYFDIQTFCHVKEKYLFEQKKTVDMLEILKKAKLLYNLAYYNSGLSNCDTACVSKRRKNYGDVTKARINYKSQEAKCKVLRDQLNQPAVEQTYQMNFYDKGFETEKIPLMDTAINIIIEQGLLFNRVPIVFSSPLAELKAYQKTLQDEYDNFWSPFKAEVDSKAKILDKKKFKDLKDAVNQASFYVKQMAAFLSNHITKNPLYKKKHTSEDEEQYRFNIAQYELRTNVANVMLATSLQSFVVDKDERKDRLKEFVQVHKQETFGLHQEKNRWKNKLGGANQWTMFLFLFSVLLIWVCIDNLWFNKYTQKKISKAYTYIRICGCLAQEEKNKA